MNEETMIALQRCIIKYFQYAEIARITKKLISNENLRNFGINLGPHNCDLCSIYHGFTSCGVCPVGNFCEDTPYTEILQQLKLPKDQLDNNKLADLFQKEAKFLITLLP